jgi:hypothetical protein
LFLFSCKYSNLLLQEKCPSGDDGAIANRWWVPGPAPMAIDGIWWIRPTAYSPHTGLDR